MPDTLARSVDLFLCAEAGVAQVVFRGRNDATPADAITWTEADKFLLRLWLLKAPGALGAATLGNYQLGAGNVLVLAGKKAPADASPLFVTTVFTEVGAGDALHYEGTVNLNTAEMVAALAAGGAQNPLPVLVDIEIQAEGNTARRTIQIPIFIRRQIYRGEGDPTPAAPAYPAAEDLVLRAPADGNYRVTGDGTLQILNPDNGLYYTIFVKTESGIPVLKVADTGEA